MRIYWFFYKLLYSAGHQALSIIPSGPFYFFFNTMLWTVFLMNCYWYVGNIGFNYLINFL